MGMSGGSYNYLFASDNLLDREEDLERMFDRLSGLKYGKAAAQETLRLLLEVRKVKVYMAEIQSRLSNVWQSVEWADSGDSSEEAVKEAIRRYEELK